MSDVFVTASGAHFHRTASCRWITLGQKAKRSSAPTTAVALDSVTGLAPCLSCYPDAPRARFHKRHCQECGSARPCPHNGGIYVKIPRVWRRGTALLAPGTVTYRRDYVWPDVAHYYDRVEESELV